MRYYNILHRDLKLGNVLIKFTDETKTHFIPKLIRLWIQQTIKYL